MCQPLKTGFWFEFEASRELRYDEAESNEIGLK
jgi:hypothetical protein